MYDGWPSGARGGWWLWWWLVARVPCFWPFLPASGLLDPALIHAYLEAWRLPSSLPPAPPSEYFPCTGGVPTVFFCFVFATHFSNDVPHRAHQFGSLAPSFALQLLSSVITNTMRKIVIAVLLAVVSSMPTPPSPPPTLPGTFVRFDEMERCPILASRPVPSRSDDVYVIVQVTFG
jgi:hypothetical protein